MKLGKVVTEIKLADSLSKTVIRQIISDVHKHKLLIFKSQGVISGDKHVEISKWFGELESTFYKHEKSPHPDVFRVSNDEKQGCTRVGRTGWHIDGSFMEQPFGYSLYHMVSIPKTGDTAFVSLSDVIESLSDEKRAFWDKLWMISDRRSGPVHPLIYSHPVTKIPTLCFHLGMTETFAIDKSTDKERTIEWRETSKILKDIHEEIVKDGRRLIYSHKWEEGDFIISDNLAVGHEATPETQFPVSEVGLRVLHRTTIKGTHTPTKNNYM